MSTAVSVATMAANRYAPRGRDELHTIFERHFVDFCEQYHEKHPATYGIYRLERIQQLGERLCTCGDYLQGVARIRCTNPECGHGYFRPEDRFLRAWSSRTRPLVTCSAENPHFHAIVLAGGFDDEGTFFYTPFSGLQSMVEVFRRRVIKLLVTRKLLSEDFARNLLSWKHSGFSIDNSVRILDTSSQEGPAEAATADSRLRSVCFPYERTVGRHAVDCRASAGRLEHFSLNGIGHA